MMEVMDECPVTEIVSTSSTGLTDSPAASSACKFAQFDDEDLPVLPRHTKVVITGNNRTKSVLVGLHGVVKKAVGLGGWHWLVLANGLEVKLQRNALSVIEPPTGLEEDDDLDDLMSCKSTIEDCGRPQKNRVWPQKSPTISNVGSKSKRVDLSKLELASLQRYLRHFHLVEVGPNPSKEQLIDAVERHFMEQTLDETQVIRSFIQAAKRLKTVCG